MSPKTIIHLTRMFVREPHVRRSLMFYSMLGSLILLFLGSTFLEFTLRQHPFWFILWWVGCAWLMLAGLLLALFDMLAIRAAAKRAERDLARKIFNENHPDEDAH